jgi:hypothetical protein
MNDEQGLTVKIAQLVCMMQSRQNVGKNRILSSRIER